MTSTTAPGVTRSFDRLSDYVTEVINARIFDGVHYRTSGEAGAEMGRKIGMYTVENYFRPLPMWSSVNKMWIGFNQSLEGRLPVLTQGNPDDVTIE